MPLAKVTDRTLPGWYFHCPIRGLVRKPGRWLDSFGPRTGDVVADLGAGGGYFLAELSRRIGPSGRIYAVDIDAAALDAARARSAALHPPVRTEFVLASAASAPQVPSSGVDFVLSNGLLCCMVDKESAVEEMWRILRPGGRALVTFLTIGPRFTARGRALKMTDKRWGELLAGHPWRPVLLTKGFVTRRYALTKSA